MGHGFDGEFIDFLAVHLGIGHAVFAQGIGRRHFDTAGRNRQEITARSVSSHSPAEDAVAFRYGADDSGTGAIAEEYTRRAVLPVDDAGQDFRTNGQNIFIHLIFDELGSNDRTVGKARAGRFQIKGSGIDRMEVGLYFTGAVDSKASPASRCRR